MFKKPFKIKSNIRMKNSEGKAFRDALTKNFPEIESELETICPKKEALFCMKAVVNNNIPVLIYVMQQRPIAFMLDDKLFPTVYLLWKCPKALMAFSTNSFVCTKLIKGADLMLAGVIKTNTFDKTFLNNAAACVNTTENIAAVAVGITAKSNREMLQDMSTGKCVLINHYYGDYLCQLDNLPLLPFPNLGPLSNTVEVDNEICNEIIEEESNDVEENSNSENVTQDLPASEPPASDTPETTPLHEQQINTNEKEMTTEEMDKLMQTCFLAALKYSKTLKLPILTSTFYKLEMITSCPLGKNLDIKKSSYKKLGQFLKAMMKLGIITVKELKKGAESITAVNKNHDLLAEFYLEKEYRPVKIEETVNNSPAPSIIESYIVTPAVLPLFEKSGLKKGDLLQERDIRNHITNFVKANNCQDAENKRIVNLAEPHLAALFKDKDFVTWEELMERVCGAMKSCFKVTGSTKEVEAKGKIQPITMKVETRTSNKKVTLIDNIELFGISISEFAKECQHGVSASTTITRPPGKKSDMLMVQGNQVLFIYNLLTEKYKIPQKYIKGMEFAVKKK